MDWKRFHPGSWSHVLGINRRNLEYVYLMNQREHFLMADDKVMAKDAMEAAGLPVPRSLAVVRYRSQMQNAIETMHRAPGFAIKPSRSFGGQGLLIVRERDGRWERPSGAAVTEEDISFHLATILAGMYALSTESDAAIVEELIVDAPVLTALHGGCGVADVRVIVVKGSPAMAMLRLPCADSEGAANLHAGGIGVGVDLASGVTTSAIQNRKPIKKHPDTGVALAGTRLPHWDEILGFTRNINDLFQMDYIGVDIVLDAHRGPLILEVNVRPGLDIQLANQAGLRPVLETLAGGKGGSRGAA